MALGLRLGAAARGERNPQRGTCRGFKKFPIRSFEKASLNSWSGRLVLLTLSRMYQNVGPGIVATDWHSHYYIVVGVCEIGA